MTAVEFAALGASYFLGAMPTSYLAGRVFKGIDLRQHGSKNLGATNVYRIMGWRYAIPVGIVDVAKGAVPVLILGPAALIATKRAHVIGTAQMMQSPDAGQGHCVGVEP